MTEPTIEELLQNALVKDALAESRNRKISQILTAPRTYIESSISYTYILTTPVHLEDEDGRLTSITITETRAISHEDDEPYRRATGNLVPDDRRRSARDIHLPSEIADHLFAEVNR
jgi:hypothetical protein